MPLPPRIIRPTLPIWTPTAGSLMRGRSGGPPVGTMLPADDRYGYRSDGGDGAWCLPYWHSVRLWVGCVSKVGMPNSKAKPRFSRESGFRWVLRWWAHLDSNQEPWDYESPALTVELWARPGTAPGVKGPRRCPRSRWCPNSVHSAEGQPTVPRDVRVHDGKAAGLVLPHGSGHATPPERRAQGT